MKKNFFEAGAERHSSNTLGPLHHKYTVGELSNSDYQLPDSFCDDPHDDCTHWIDSFPETSTAGPQVDPGPYSGATASTWWR